MRTYPITDHIPESELTAITPEGAARWLTRKGWAPTEPVAFTLGAVSVAIFVSDMAQHYRVPPRTIIAEMQADSRIAAECARMAARASKAAQPTETIT